MNFWEYLEKRNKRKYFEKQLHFYRKEGKSHTAIVDEIPIRLLKVYGEMSVEIREKIKFYEDQLKNL